MKKSRTSSTWSGTSRDVSPSPVILVIGEDAVCRGHGSAVMARVNRLLPEDTTALVQVKDFSDILAETGSPATTKARPNLVVVSVRGNHPLPAGIRSWLDKWAKSTHGLPSALTAVFDRRYQASAVLLDTWSYLQELAGQAGIDWIAATGAMLPRGDEGLRNDLTRQATTVSSTLSNILHTPRPPPRTRTV